jgi:hypothetical protein
MFRILTPPFANPNSILRSRLYEDIHPANHVGRQGVYDAPACERDFRFSSVEVEPAGVVLHAIDAGDDASAEDGSELERAMAGNNVEDRSHLERPAEGSFASRGLQGEVQIDVVGFEVVKMLLKLRLSLHAPERTWADDDLELIDRHVCYYRGSWENNSFGRHMPHLSATPLSPGEKDVVRRLLGGHLRGEDLSIIVPYFAGFCKLCAREESNPAPDREFSKRKKTPVLGRLLICKSKMVRERDTFWSPFLESVLKVDARLTQLGFIYFDGEVSIVQTSEPTDD